MTFQPWKLVSDHVQEVTLLMLQWGHDFSAMEIRWHAYGYLGR